MTGHPLRRRTLLAGLALAPALVACSPSGRSAASGPDPRIALADAARADAALATAAIAADSSLAKQLDAARTARQAHATALDAALGRPTATPAPAAAPRTGSTPGLPEVRDAIAASAKAAGALVQALPTDQVGLVASVAACCAAYAAVL